MQALERFLAWGGVKKDMVLLAVSAISLILSMLVPTGGERRVVSALPPPSR